jgi:hypothetical protein
MLKPVRFYALSLQKKHQKGGKLQKKFIRYHEDKAQLWEGERLAGRGREYLRRFA